MTTKLRLRWMAIPLTIIAICGQNACIRWHRHALTEKDLPRLVRHDREIFLVNSGTGRSVMWQIGDPVLTNDTLKGRIVQVSEQIASRILDAHTARGAKQQRNRVLLYAKTGSFFTENELRAQGVPLSDISRIEAFDVDAGATVGLSLLCTAGVFGAMILIIAATKSSCPFVFTKGIDGNHFEGELFSGAIYPQLQRHDRLPLQYIEPVNGRYVVQLANKAHEEQSTDLLELLAVDHAPGSRPLFDRYGTVHSLRAPQPPTTAVDLNGTDVRELIIARDDSAWRGDENNMRPEANDGMELTFHKPLDVRHGKLVITARNSFWLDHLYGLFLDELGTYAPDIERKNLEQPAERLKNWSRSQRLPLSVSVQIASGEWKHMDQFELAGPMAWREDVLMLDLGDVVGDEVRIRLDCGFQFWDIDQVAFDPSDDDSMLVRTIPMESATDRNGRNVRASMLTEDGQCYFQPHVDDAATIAFPVLEMASGKERSLFLHGAGHYHILRPAQDFTPSLLYLRGFTKPDALPNYSRDRWHELEKMEFAQPL